MNESAVLPVALVVGASFAYLLMLFAVAAWGDRRAGQGRSVIGNAWVYALSMGVYCTAWTYFGSVGRAADSGVWFLPIYLGPTLAMILAGVVLRKIIRIARAHRLTSIADFIASRHGKSPSLAALVTLIAVIGIVPYMALQLKAVASGFTLLTGTDDLPAALEPWWRDSTLYIALVLAGFTMIFGTRHLDATERHEGLVAAIAVESVVKLVAFLAVGAFVSWSLFDGPGQIFERSLADPAIGALLAGDASAPFAYDQWFALMLLAMLSVILLPRQFQVIVIENVDERHLRRASWAFPLYLLLINLFVLPIALGGLLHFRGAVANPETFVLSLPMSAGAHGLALLAFVGGLSAATGMVIVEAIAVATMLSNDLVMPLLLRTRRFGLRAARDLTGLLLGIRRVAILALLLLGYLYFRLAGEAYALVSIGLISFAAVAQFAPALFGGIYWKGGTRDGALAGLAAGFALWVYTLMLPSIARSGWLGAGLSGFVRDGPFGIGWLRPEQLFGMTRLDGLTHALFWSLLVNAGLYVVVSLARRPSAREASQAMLFVDVPAHAHPAGAGDAAYAPVFWRGRARVADLRALAARFLGREAAERLLADYAARTGAVAVEAIPADARLVQFVESQLAGAIGSASARVMVASVVEEEPLAVSDVARIVDEATQLRAHSRELERVGDELRAANEQLMSLDRLKDDFMSSVTHELRTPLTSIRALAELIVDDPDMESGQRQRFVGIIVSETERLSRLVDQVLDMAKIESGNAEWHDDEVDLRALLERAVQTARPMLQERGAQITLAMPPALPAVRADADRLMQVMMNLLSNAAKFVPREGGRIDVRLDADERGVRVEVQDNGPGVPPGQQALVFEKFRQADSGTARREGTGLGLPISRSIVEHLGGTMWLHSPPGRGACVGFELPWRKTP
ncbi:MAG: sensor histidine kinase [Burkholderiaceae bacterium]|nr:sensor histidine kinase [Burkholderiaceae bacterium]